MTGHTNQHAARLRAIKGESGCADCGFRTDTRQLHFHHVDPGTKRFTIMRGLKLEWPVIEAEVAKCVVLCAPCHRKRHGQLRLAGGTV